MIAEIGFAATGPYAGRTCVGPMGMTVIVSAPEAAQTGTPMRVAAILLALCALFLPLAAGGQAPKPAHPEGAHAAKSYVPGLEQFMNVIQNEHAKLWYAGTARNWPLAAYQLAEIKEVMSDVQDLVPTFKDLPLADMLDAVITGEIAQLEKAIDGKDAAAFDAGFDKLTAACNACHRATGNGFIVMRRPSGPGFPNQDFSPRQ